jgi:hypothetical protein
VKWFVRTMHAHLLLVAAGALGAMTVIVRDASLVIPVVGPGTPFGDLPLATVIPLLVVILIGSAQHAASPPELATSARGVAGMLVFSGLATCTFFVFANAATAVLFGAESLSVARNTFGYFNLLLFGQLLLGLRLGPSVPPLYLFLSTVFGRGPNGMAQPWAWPVQPASVPDLTLTVVGTAVITALLAARGLPRDALSR